MDLMELPLEILEKILKFLSKNDLQKCKKINRKFYQVINRLKYSRLVITDTWYFEESWFYEFESIEYDKIKIKSFETFNLPNQFINLKQLFLYSTKDYDKEIRISNLINSLTQLENLSLIGLNVYENECINLKSLKTFNFYISDEINYYDIILNTPNLENLKNSSRHCSFGLIIQFPASVKRLYALRIDDEFDKKFSNLEYLYLECVYDDLSLILLQLPKLKQIYIRVFYDYDLLIYLEILDKLGKLNGLNSFKAYFLGINFTNLNCLDDINSYSISDTNFTLYKKYFNNLSDKFYFISSLSYNDFEDVFDNNNGSIDFIKKFVDVNELRITRKVKRVDQLINVLDCFSNRMRNLIIKSANLDQIEFYNRLPRIITFLDTLIIKDERKLSFNFLIKFHSIKSVEINQNIKEKIITKFTSKFKNEFRSINYIKNNRIPIFINNYELNGELTIRKGKVIQKPKKSRPIDDLNLDEFFDYNCLDGIEIGKLL